MPRPRACRLLATVASAAVAAAAGRPGAVASPPGARERAERADARRRPRRPAAPPTSTCCSSAPTPTTRRSRCRRSAVDRARRRPHRRAHHHPRRGRRQRRRPGGGPGARPDPRGRGARRRRQAGIPDIYNLDEVDFYYTVSATLTQQVWGHDSTLGKVVRLVRETTPEVIMTMDPAPSRATTATTRTPAGWRSRRTTPPPTPSASPSQITQEDLRAVVAPPRAPRQARSTATGTGPACATDVHPDATRPRTSTASGAGADPSAGARPGRRSSARRSASTPARAGRCSRTCRATPTRSAATTSPRSTAGSRSRAATTRRHGRPTTCSQGSLVRSPDGLPLGTQLDLSTPTVRGGRRAARTLTVTAHAPAGRALRTVPAASRCPPAGRSRSTYRSAGWPRASRYPHVQRHGTRRAGRTSGSASSATAARAAPRRLGMDQPLEVVPPVTGHPAAAAAGRASSTRGPPTSASRSSRASSSRCSRWPPAAPARCGSTSPTTATRPHVGHGRARPAGGLHAAEPRAVRRWPPARHQRRRSPSPTPTTRCRPRTRAATDGDYDYTIPRPRGRRSSRERAALELVPTDRDPARPRHRPSTATIGAGEYAGRPLDLSRLWEGEACDVGRRLLGHRARDPAGDALYVPCRSRTTWWAPPLAPRLQAALAHRLGGDRDRPARRRRRTPRRRSRRRCCPTTRGRRRRRACFERDADNHQGPGARDRSGHATSPRRSSDDGLRDRGEIPRATCPRRRPARAWG